MARIFDSISQQRGELCWLPNDECPARGILYDGNPLDASGSEQQFGTCVGASQADHLRDSLTPKILTEGEPVSGMDRHLSSSSTTGAGFGRRVTENHSRQVCKMQLTGGFE